MNENSVQLELLGTAACHLCEQVEGALLNLQHSGLIFDYRKVDISEDDKLFEQYALLIPVLRNAVGKELRWPFGGDELLAFIQG
ncbi:MAG: glutaredoxin family protein [Parahaliea sp.]